MGINTVIGKLSDPIRSGHWWKYKAAHLLGFAYLFFYRLTLPLKEAVLLLLLSSLTIIGIAGLGYVINDLYDIEIDRKAGKKNRMADKSSIQRMLVVIVLLAFAFFPWLYLRSHPMIWLLIGVEF